MEILKLIEAKNKGKLIVESCVTITQLDSAKKYVEQFYKIFDDLVSYSELKIMINNKRIKLKEMNTLKNVMYAGMGLAKHTDDKIKEQFDALVAKGKMVDKEGKNLVKGYFDIVEDLKKEADEKLTKSLNSNIDKVEEFLQNLKR